MVRRNRRGGATAATLGTLTLGVPGRHSVQNALAAIAVGLELDAPFDRIASALAEFGGAERRFERRGVIGGITVVDDYGHHPTEIAAVLAAARAAKPSRIVVAFQPHRYTRTRDLMAEFGTALATADEVVLTDIYAASEDPIPGVTIEALAAAVNGSRTTPVHVVPRLEQMAAAVADLARAGDLVLTLGAGSIGGLAGGAGRRARAAPRPEGGGVMALATATDKRFRRAHVKPARKRSLAAKQAWAAARAAVLCALLIYGGYRGVALVADAQTLQISHLVVRGHERLSAGEVLALVDGLRGQNILTARLDGWQQRLMASPWVEGATIRRVLPSTVEITVHERRPMGIGRIGTALYLIDGRA